LTAELELETAELFL